jgi:hypothetical protein
VDKKTETKQPNISVLGSYMHGRVSCSQRPISGVFCMLGHFDRALDDPNYPARRMLALLPCLTKLSKPYPLLLMSAPHFSTK